jgi:hypothetical protein
MTSSKPQWIPATSGHQAPGTPGERDVSYPVRGGDGVTEIRLRHELAGVWIAPSPLDPSYQVVRLPRGRCHQVPGAPAVPVDVFSLALPPGTRIVPDELTVQVGRTQVCDGNYRLAPAPPPTIEGQDVGLAENPEIYASDDWYPQIVASCAPVSEVDGLLRTVVTIYPVAFAPRSGRLLLRTHVELTLPSRRASASTRVRHPVDWHSPLVRSVVGYEQLAPH